MARFGSADILVTTKPRETRPAWSPTGPPADYSPRSTPASYLNASSAEENVREVAQLSGLSISGYDDFTSSKSLSTNRPHLVAAYNPNLDISNINNPVFQLAEVQYLLDSDSVSTTTQIISSSLAPADHTYITAFNSSLFVQAKRIIDSLRTVYVSKRRLSRFLAGFEISATATRSADYRGNLANQIGFSNLFIDSICRQPFFGKSNLDDYFSSIPTSIPDFKEKTFASRIFNLALMSNDLCFFPQSVVSTFGQSQSVGDFGSSALYIRDTRYPDESSTLPDYVTLPDDDTLEQCMLGLARMISETDPFKSRRRSQPLNVYDADLTGEFEGNFQSLLSSFFFNSTSTRSRIEVFSRSNFSNAMPDGYASFEDAIVLPSFSKDQKDSDGFRQSSSTVSSRISDLSSRVSDFSQSTSRFSPLDPDNLVLRYASGVLNVVGDVLTWLGLEMPRLSAEDDVDWIPALQDIACIIQRTNDQRDRFSEILPSTASGIRLIFPEVTPGSGDTLSFERGDMGTDESAGRIVSIIFREDSWSSSGLYTDADAHPIFSRIDGSIRINFGSDINEQQLRAYRSFAIQLIGRALRNVFIRFTKKDADINDSKFYFYKTDLAAIPRAINYLTTGEIGTIIMSGDEDLTVSQNLRIRQSREKIQQNIFSSLRTLTDQAMMCLEICDIGESVRSTMTSLSTDLPTSLTAAATVIQSSNNIRGISPVIALTRESLVLMSSELFRRTSISNYQYYNSKEVMSEEEFKLSSAKILDDTLEADDEDDLTYYFVGFPFGFLERCRGSTSVDTDTFNVTFRFIVGDVVSEVVKTFSPNMKKQEIFPGDAREPINLVSPDIVRCISYIDGIEDLVPARLGDTVFSSIGTSRKPTVQAALSSGCAADFVWNLLGVDLSETFVFDPATYSEPARNSQIRADQERSFAQRISSLDNASKARLGSAFQRTNLFGQKRSIDDVFGFKYFDCIYAFPVKTSEVPNIDRNQIIGRVFISVEPSTTITKGSF